MKQFAQRWLRECTEPGAMPMNPETLERLLLDRSLGVLSPDAAALLDAYLARDPDAFRRAAALDATVDLARQAMADDAPAGQLPPFPAERLQRTAVAFRRWRIIGRAAALAACIVLGVLIGLSLSGGDGPAGGGGAALLVSRQSDSPTTDEPSRRRYASRLFAQPESAAAPVYGAARMTSDGDEEFWSRRRIARRASAAVSTEQPGWIWQSPIHRPKLRGAS